MNWKKISTEKLPSEPYIYTDGKRITVAGKDIYGKKLVMGDNASFEQATHYILLSDIPKPQGTCSVKCLRCCN